MQAAHHVESDETTPLLRKATKGKAQQQDGGPQSANGSALGAPQSKPSVIDAQDIDKRFKRWIDHIRRKRRPSEDSPLERNVQFWLTVFYPVDSDQELLSRCPRTLNWPNRDAYLGLEGFERQLQQVKQSIADGLQPKMIQTGSSGSYFIRVHEDGHQSTSETPSSAQEKIVAVFKPHDEEPYGDLNPKRVFLRRYLWWAMGRACLIASFSYLSEVGASLLDDQLKLGIVPTTKLVNLASSSFFYAQSDRNKNHFPEKKGSYQHFLNGYMNASEFLRANPWPSRPRDLLEQDLEAENLAHGRAKARKRKGKVQEHGTRTITVKKVLSAVSLVNCLAPLGFSSFGDEEQDERRRKNQANSRNTSDEGKFEWTKELMQDFRLELEKLVCFDYLIRNTDRGLDNFMIKVHEPIPGDAQAGNRRRLTLCAIDNSLAFPWKHPAGIRSYPWGWLYLPTDLIGGPFSPETRAAFVSYLNDPSWWHQTRGKLETLFKQDAHFDEKKFEGQMDVLRGQGWNLLESLRNEDEGPLELCAREKRLVEHRTEILTIQELGTRPDYQYPITPQAHAIKAKLQALKVVQSNSNEATQTSATSIQVPRQPKAGGQGARQIDDDCQPRSLPETELDHGKGSRGQGIAASPHVNTSVFDHVGRRNLAQGAASSHETHEEDAALGRAYRRGSLGIDVLAQIDQNAARTRRPGFRKAITRGASVSRIPRAASAATPPQPLRSESNNSVTREANGHGDRQSPFKAPASRLEEADEEQTRLTASASGDDLISSVASLDTHPYSTPAQRRPHESRRRIGSVSDSWSIASALNIGSAAAGQAPSATAESMRKLKVISEHLEIDDGVAWQTWLGLS